LNGRFPLHQDILFKKNLRNVFRHFVIGFKSMGSTLEKMSSFDGKEADEKLNGA
jgi:hypothetical protein